MDGSQPIAVSVADAVQMSGISRSKLYELIADGQIATRRVGRRRLVLVKSLRAYLEDGLAA